MLALVLEEPPQHFASGPDLSPWRAVDPLKFFLIQALEPLDRQNADLRQLRQWVGGPSPQPLAKMHVCRRQLSQGLVASVTLR
jgi:hypothetical protein